MRVVQHDPMVSFTSIDLPTLRRVDDQSAHGKVEFRHLAPLIADYAGLQVHAVQEGEAR